MNKRILIIGQAPPSPKTYQDVPYSTTMLYDWLAECSIDKIEAQEMFEFEAMVSQFPGFSSNGHAKPTQNDMMRHWLAKLADKVNLAEKVILLGNVPRDFLMDSTVWFEEDPHKFLCLLHPSKRNYDRYIQNKEQIINSLKEFLK